MDARETRESSPAALTTPEAPARFVTAAALYDGHDAAINMVRRGLVAAGAEVVHLGHNRAAEEVAKAAIEEDASAVAISSYQGGHEEFYLYLRQLLDSHGARDVAIFGGGGGVIQPEEIARLEARGVEKIFTPDDGLKLGIDGMMRRMVDGALSAARRSLAAHVSSGAPARLPSADDPISVARAITAVELALSDGEIETDPSPRSSAKSIVLGVTGTGGAGKSSMIDELVLRLTRDFPELRIAILAVDPTKRKTGGALLGDRIRMNAIYRPQVFLRSLATRASGSELSSSVQAATGVLARAGYDLLIVETAGIGQGSSAVLDVSGLSLYVMTPEFGGPTQLEKIDMLDFADIVAVNKSDRRGAEDAAKMVRRQVSRARKEAAAFVALTRASRFNDPGVNDLYAEIVRRLGALSTRIDPSRAHPIPSAPAITIVPPARDGHLREAADCVRAYRQRARADVEAIRQLDSLRVACETLSAASPPASRVAIDELRAAIEARRRGSSEVIEELEGVEKEHAAYRTGKISYTVRGREHSVDIHRGSLSGLPIPRVALPPYESRAELLRFAREENLPGRFPFTAGVFPFKRDDELPTRQFAGEGTPERTNRRYHLLTEGSSSRRLSVAFDSVTLYGSDPDERPDIYGKIGTSGVSIATLDDMKKLFRGFDLTDPATSVSMTINGPAPVILAMFFRAAIAQEVEKLRAHARRDPTPEEAAKIRSQVLESVRGTVQADILKEDQAQNTCILSTELALKLMCDVQESFIRNRVRNFYSVSISGYHIREAGATPITQLAFTLANGLTYLEFYRSRGLQIDDFVPNFSFFFSNGLDPEYSVLGRVARRIWAVVLRDLYGASERSQKLKYHIQTSGRSLHAREIQLNDIRTTLQALMAVQDNCNSLHTNAYDEAITTPTEESVRRAMAIQLIVQRELGLTKNENPLQGAFLTRELTDLVEAAVLEEFERLADRGGVLGAMETSYMRTKIQEESLHYEQLKHSGELPIVGVNTFLLPPTEASRADRVPVVRSTEDEKQEQIRNLRAFQTRNGLSAGPALLKLRETALRGGNIFDELMDCVEHASLGQITGTLYDVGGQYRRSL